MNPHEPRQSPEVIRIGRWLTQLRTCGWLSTVRAWWRVGPMRRALTVSGRFEQTRPDRALVQVHPRRQALRHRSANGVRGLFMFLWLALYADSLGPLSPECASTTRPITLSSSSCRFLTQSRLGSLQRARTSQHGSGMVSPLPQSIGSPLCVQRQPTNVLSPLPPYQLSLQAKRSRPGTTVYG